MSLKKEIIMWKKFTSYIRQLVNVYIREFKVIGADSGILLFCLFLPLAYPIIYSLIYNPEVVRDVKMVVVDHDRTPKSRELVRNLDATPEAKVIGYAADLSEAQRAMNSHKCYAILEIPEGFDRKLGRSESADAVIYCEMSLLLRYRGFLVASTNVAQAMSAKIQAGEIGSLGAASMLGSGDLMPVSYIAMGNTEGGFDSFVMPGVLILILHQCLVLAIAMRGGARHEKAEMIGYNPLNSQPSVLATMVGQMLCYATIMFVPMLYLVHYVPLMFSFPQNGDICQILAFLLPMVIACMSIGMIMQGVTKQRETVFVYWVVTSVIFLFLSGLTWPRFAMPQFWQWLGSLCPATWGVQGFIRMNANGASLWQVRADYSNLWILATVYFVAAYFVQRRLAHRFNAG
jgi:ABC-2 type transport system permease protein